MCCFQPSGRVVECLESTSKGCWLLSAHDEPSVCFQQSPPSNRQSNTLAKTCRLIFYWAVEKWQLFYNVSPISRLWKRTRGARSGVSLPCKKWLINVSNGGLFRCSQSPKGTPRGRFIEWQLHDLPLNYLKSSKWTYKSFNNLSTELLKIKLMCIICSMDERCMRE